MIVISQLSVVSMKNFILLDQDVVYVVRVCLVLQRAANSDINEDVHVSFLCSQDMGWRCWLIFNQQSSCKLSVLPTSVSTTFGSNCSEPQLIPIFGILSLMELLGFTCILVLELPQKVTLWMIFNVADHLSQSGDGSLYHLPLNVSTLEVSDVLRMQKTNYWILFIWLRLFLAGVSVWIAHLFWALNAILVKNHILIFGTTCRCMSYSHCKMCIQAPISESLDQGTS